MMINSTVSTGAVGLSQSRSRARLLGSICLLSVLPVGAALAQTPPAAPQDPGPTGASPTQAVSDEVGRLRHELSLEAERSRRLSEELTRLQEASLREKSEQDSLAAGLGETRSRLEQATGQLETLQVDLQRLLQRLETAEKTLADARQQIGSLTAERDSLKSELLAAQQDLADRERQLTTVTEERDRLERAAADAQKQLADKDAALSAAEAERADLSGQLARTSAERDQGAAALAAVTTARDATQSRLDGAEGELASLRGALASMTGERDQLTGQLASSEEKAAALDKHVFDTRSELEAERAEVARLNGEVSQVNRQNADLQADLASLRGDLQAARDDSATLRSEITGLKSGLPPQLGGSASLGQLQAAAAGIADQMRVMHRTLRRQPENASLRAQFDTAAQRLRERQLLIAGETGAVGLYRLRPEDTLAAVALRFLGDANQWGRIHEVNRHILPDPDRLIAGLTLVLP
jgi:chromosome segregation ATPase